MRKMIVMSILSLAMSSLLGCSSGSDSADQANQAAPESASARAHRMVEEGATLVDVRSPAEYNSGHIDGAINIPLQVVGQRMSEIPTDHEVVVYCLSGARSGAAMRQLQANGYTVHNLGGISAW